MMAGLVAFSAAAAPLTLPTKSLQKAPVAKKTVSKTATAVASEKAVKTADIKKSRKSLKARKADGVQSIEGTWTFTFGDYYFQSSVGGEIQGDFVATLEGTQVTFEDPEGNFLPFVAEFDEEEGELTFGVQLLGRSGTYYVYQQPQIFDYDEEDFVEVDNIYGDYIGDAIYFYADNFYADPGLQWVACTAQNITTAAGFFNILDIYEAERVEEEIEVEWVEMVDATFNENIIYSLFTGTQNTTVAPVQVLENPVTPGIYKLLNPFGVLYQALGFTSQSPTMVIDATDPENVMVELQSTGINGGTDGVYYYFNEGWYSWEYDEELDPSLVCTLTTDEDGYTVITFPYHSFTVYASTSNKFYYGSAYESVLKFKAPSTEEPVEATITIGEVSYNAYPNNSVNFQVPVTSEGLAEDAVITVYYQLSTEDEFTAVAENHGQFDFTIENLEPATEYSVTIYAASGDVRSDDVEVTFKTFEAPAAQPVAEIIDQEVLNITSSSATIHVAYGFRDVPEGGVCSVIVTDGVARQETKVVIENPVYGASVDVDLTDLTSETEYPYMVVAQIEDADGNILTRSNIVYGQFTTTQETTGIDGVNADAANARYFNLNGVEVKAPEKGAYIKVEGEKATKVMIAK